MNCKELEFHAIEYLDGTLASGQAQAVELHRADCAACAERLRGFSAVSGLLDGWEGIRPSAAFNARLEQRILEQPAAAAGWWSRLSSRFVLLPFGKPALAGAMLAVALIAAVVVQYYPGSPGAISQGPTASPATAPVVTAGNDDLALYQDLLVLENWELLSNFEVLQELETTTP